MDHYSLLYQIKTGLVLDKNPDQFSKNDFESIKKIIEENVINHIFCSEPFVKIAFLNQMILQYKIPIIYLDFDLLYSGYTISGSISPRENITIFQPTKVSWNEIIKKILVRISKERSLLIIDSLNGFYNLFDEGSNVGRLINSYIMLFASLAVMSNSKIVVNSMARIKDGKEWVLSLTGRQILRTKDMSLVNLKHKDSDILLNRLGSDNSEKKSLTVPTYSEII